LKETEVSEVENIGLKELTEEDITTISEKAYSIVQKQLIKHIPSRKIKSYDIIIDIDTRNDKLVVDIDINIDFPNERIKDKNESLIRKIIEASFVEIDSILEEKFTR
jgi:hypothetical protein